MAVGTGTALLLAAAAAGASAYNTNQTTKRADRTAAEGIRTQAANQRTANARVGKTIGDLGKSDASAAKKTAGKQYLDQVRASMGQANAGLTRKGLGAEFAERAGGAAAANEQFGADTADLLARMDAPTLQRMSEGNTVGDTGMDLAALGSKIQGDAFVNQLKLNGVRRNPWLDAASAALSGVASGGSMTGAGGAGGGGSTGAVPVTATNTRIGTGPY